MRCSAKNSKNDCEHHGPVGWGSITHPRKLVPSARGDGCPATWYEIGDLCFQFVNESPKTWSDANQACMSGDSRASLAIIKDYITQAVIVSLMKNVDGDVYIGLQSTKENPVFHWPNGDLWSYERWAVGEPDGNVFLTPHDYCVTLDNSNPKLPGRWFDVPCSEEHKYICSMPLDPDLDTSYPQPGQQCLTGFSPYLQACIGLFSKTDELTTYADAQTQCASHGDSRLDVSLATVLDGYESAVLNVLMYAMAVDSAWIGFSIGAEGAFEWESGQPVVYTNWGNDEPSSGIGEGCVKEYKDGYWDDTTCLDKAAYFCRYDVPPLIVPTPAPDINAPCPTDGNWESFGSYCYSFPTNEAQWGEANFRCMQQHGASLASITTASENQFILSNSKHQSGSDNYMWLGLSRIQITEGDWGKFGWVDGTEFNYALWSKGEPDGNNPDTLEFCTAMSIGSQGTWMDVFCHEKYQYVCKLRKRPANNYDSTICMGDTGNELVAVGSYCYLPSTILVSPKRGTWNQAENACRLKGGHLVSIHDEEEQILIRKLAFSFTQSYWIGMREHEKSGTFAWSDDTLNDYTNYPSGGPVDLLGEEQCADFLVWKDGMWETSACGNVLPFICKRENKKVTVIDPIPPPPSTGSCPVEYFKLGTMCYQLRGVAEEDRKSWIDARDDCKTLPGGTLATVNSYGQQAILTAIIKALERRMDMWIGLNSIGIHYQYHWTDETPLEFTQWMEGQPDSNEPIADPNSQTCVVMVNSPEYAGQWNDVQCSIERAYLCQAHIDPSNPNNPPVVPPGNCPNLDFYSYFDTCLTIETTAKMSFDDARKSCQSKSADLLSTYDQYEVSFLSASLYEDSLEPDGEGWIGMIRNAKTNRFEWLDNWPMLFTSWANDEPNNNNGDCVALDKKGKWVVRDCSEKKYYFCEYPNIKPTTSSMAEREGCLDNYVELPDSDFCYIFKTANTKILQEAGDYFCNRDYSGRLPSIHSKAEEDYVKQEAKKVFGTNALVWLGLDRAKNGRNRWMDRTVLDYVNWITGEPNGDDEDTCTALNVDGGWLDIDCTVMANYVCKTPKFLKPPPTVLSGATPQPVCGLTALLLLSVASVLAARR